LSVTGYGLGEDRVAFGDDAAAAGGMVVRDDQGPCFCADAVADPLAGLVGAAAVLDSLAVGRGGLIDVSMAGLAASFVGPTVPLPDGIEVASPTAGRRRGPAPPLGADTDAVLHEVGWRA
jgi:crotonobetainyl-CoA:carnitine CoA-transferase CaiB-like acyl-CoA transferase